MMRKIRNSVARHRMISRGDMVVVACSGGADSICLLDAMLRLKDDLGITVAAAHLDHGLRGETAKRDADFVAGYAAKKGVPFVGGSVDAPAYAKKHKLSIEEAARESRYRFFEGIPARFPDVPAGKIKIALGHTADDQAETVLMRLLRGGGVKGLAAIPPKRGAYIRPLIDTTREEIVAHLKKHRIAWVEDETNASDEYLRNRIRSSLIPQLKRDYNPNIVETLSKTAAAFRDVSDYLDERAESFVGKMKIAKGEVVVALDILAKAHPAVAASIIELAISKAKGSTWAIRAEHRRDILEAALAGERASFSLPGGVEAEIAKGRLRLYRRDESNVEYEIGLVVPGATFIEATGAVIRSEIVAKKAASVKTTGDATTVYFDLDAIRGPLEVRNFRRGDRFRPFGMNGSKKIHDLLVDAGVPRSERLRLPIVVCGDGILWVAPLRRSDLYPVAPKTKRILKLELSGEIGNCPQFSR